MKRLKNGGFEVVWEEWVLVGGLETSDSRVELFSLSECPVEEAEVAVWYFESSRFVDCAVERELYSLDKVESNCVFQSTEEIYKYG